MTSIAVVGIEGSGKTVLATMLAKRYSEWVPDQPFFEPMNPQTVNYVERAWHTLNEGDWPPSTPPGELAALNWRLHFDQSMVCDLHMIDAAGQDLRQLFGEGRVHDYDALPPDLQQLASSVVQADIILLLANLGDFLGEPDELRRVKNECAIKFLLDFVQTYRAECPPHICVVLTQIDRYRGNVKQYRSLTELVQKHMPILYAFHLNQGSSHLLAISAVSETQVFAATGESPRRVPKPPIRSRGLDELMAWLRNAVIQIKAHPPVPHETAGAACQQPPTRSPGNNELMAWLRNAMIQIKSLLLVPQEKPVATGQQQTQAEQWQTLILVASGFLGLFFVGLIFRSPTAKPAPTMPIPVIITEEYQENRTFFGDTITAYGSVQNTGIFGKVRVTSWIIEDGVEVDQGSQDFVLNPGEIANYQIQLPRVKNLDHKIQKQTIALTPGL